MTASLARPSSAVSRTLTTRLPSAAVSMPGLRARGVTLIASLRVVVIIDVGENIIAPFEGRKPRFINATGFDHLVEAIEPQTVIFRAFHSIRHHRAGLHDERPVTRLRQQQFAGRLLECSLDEMVAVFVVASKLGHPVSR